MRKGKKNLGGYIPIELHDAFTTHARLQGLSNTELLLELITNRLNQSGSESRPTSQPATLGLHQFADRFNNMFFEEDGDEKEVVLEIELRSKKQALRIPGIKVKANTSIARVCHAYANHLADNEPNGNKEAKAAKVVVESMQLEYQDKVYTYTKLKDGSVKLVSSTGVAVDPGDEIYELLINLYEQSTKD